MDVLDGTRTAPGRATIRCRRAVQAWLACAALGALEATVAGTVTSADAQGESAASRNAQAQSSQELDGKPQRSAAADTLRPFEGFAPGWDSGWEHRRFGRSPTRYTVVDDAGSRVLEARSEASASGLWRRFDVRPEPDIEVAWRWRVEASLAGNDAEREKRGDDFAARVFVVFEPSWLHWKTRALCYVWAAQETIGSVFPNAHAGNVRTIVLQSGNREANRWVTEHRWVYADYLRAFGKEPRRISGVAVMVDTDNTGSAAVARFDSLTVVVPKRH